MGKGDQKSRRGKIFAGSYGKTRTKNSGSKTLATPTLKEEIPKVEKPKKPTKTSNIKEEEKPKGTRKKKTEE